MHRAGRHTFGDFVSCLKLDDVLHGSVVEPEGNDNYIVNLNGYNIMACSKVKLDQGMKVWARVKALHPKVELVIVTENELLGKVKRINRAV
jgi:hypothetical protein